MPDKYIHIYLCFIIFFLFWFSFSYENRQKKKHQKLLISTEFVVKLHLCESIGKNRQLSFCCFVCFKSVYNLVLLVFFSLFQTASGFRRLYIDYFLSHFHKTNSFFFSLCVFFVHVLFFYFI